MAVSGILKISCLELIKIVSLIWPGCSSSLTRMLTTTYLVMPGAIIPYCSYLTAILISLIGLIVIR